MIQLTYTSHAAVPITPTLVIDMLDAARRNNGPRGVTGLLYYAQGQFAQCLEGDADEVEAIFSKIKGDARHQKIRETRQNIAARAFPDWSMAFVDSSTAEVARVLMKHGIDSYEAAKWPINEVASVLESFAFALRAERIPILL